MLSRRAFLCAAIGLLAATSVAWQQPSDGGKQAVQQRVAELKQSVAANQQNLRKYQWLETTTVDVKGDTKKTEQKLCQYGPDGKVEKTPIGTPPQPQAVPRGIKGRIVAKKTGEMKDYMGRLKSLVSEYVPPNREKIQEVFQAGNADLDASSGGVTSLILKDYYKQGDKVTFAFDSRSKKIQSLTVNTWLDDPKNDIVNVSANFSSLPDGTNHVQQTDLQSKSKEIEIMTVNSNYQKGGQ